MPRDYDEKCLRNAEEDIRYQTRKLASTMDVLEDVRATEIPEEIKEHMEQAIAQIQLGKNMLDSIKREILDYL